MSSSWTQHERRVFHENRQATLSCSIEFNCNVIRLEIILYFIILWRNNGLKLTVWHEWRRRWWCDMTTSDNRCQSKPTSISPFAHYTLISLASIKFSRWLLSKSFWRMSVARILCRITRNTIWLVFWIATSLKTMETHLTRHPSALSFIHLNIYISYSMRLLYMAWCVCLVWHIYVMCLGLSAYV